MKEYVHRWWQCNADWIIIFSFEDTTTAHESQKFTLKQTCVVNFTLFLGIAAPFILYQLNWIIFSITFFWLVISERSIHIVSYRYTDFMSNMWKCIYSINKVEFCYLQNSISNVTNRRWLCSLHESKYTRRGNNKTSSMFNFRLY